MLNFINDQKRISFLLNGEDFSSFIKNVENYEKNGETITVYTFNSGLKLTHRLRHYPEYNACDWVNEWENDSENETELISALWDCDVLLPLSPRTPKTTGGAYLPKSENAVKVYSPCGSNWSSDEFSCRVDRLTGNNYENWLLPNRKKFYANTGGRSAESGRAPFFNIKNGNADEGYIVAVGWTGQWNAEVEHCEGGARFRSKIEDTSFRLLPGEKFRTSSVTVMAYRGDMQDGQNAWRRLVKDIYSPVGKREVPTLAPFCAGLWGGMSSSGCVERIKKVEAAELPFDHYWMDAGWYGAGTQSSPDEYEGDWAQHTGNWEINKARHPDGMKDVVAEIEKTNKRFLLWFEPERVRNIAPIFSEHPEYFISIPTNSCDMLLDLGSEAAWNYCFNTLSDMIKRLNVSVYRQDFNFSPLPYWRTRNTEGRVGITEIKHINGLYRLWDALLEKFPYLLIDNCASGGRRIDIETLRRSVPLWRSDAQCPADPVPELTQAHSLSHSQWMPYSGTGVGRIWFDTYRFRSAYAPALTTNFTFSEKNSFGDNPDEMAWLAKMCSEFVRVRPYLSEDYYKLTEPTDAHDVWSAIQYNRPNMGDGIVQIFRRDSSPYEEACFVLRGLDESKKYLFEDADGGELILDGKNLATDGFRVRISEKRCAKLYFYKQI